MKILKYSLLVSIMYLLSGCVSQPSIPKVEEAEIAKYEKAYMAEYERIKIEMASSKINGTWVQPKNKKEECKVKIFFQTNKPDYSLFWDGECKDGYAEGLGSTFEIEQFANRQVIAIFKKGEPDTYRVFFNHIDGITNEGEYTNSVDKPVHSVLTRVDEKNNDLKISYEFYVGMSNDSPGVKMRTYPFYDVVEYFQDYPNFSYVIADLTKNEFDNRNYEFNILDNKNGKFNGYGFSNMKKGGINAYEMVNGTLVRSVQLPQSYFDKANSILSEIKRHANIALEAQKKALIIKEKYKKKICQDSIKVDFMDNNEYKAICKEDEKFAQLKTKIDAKLAQINQEKQLKRAQMGQERLIQAQEAQARAAQQQASAARAQANAVQQRADDSYWSDFNTNMQLMQLNNNLMKLK